jgi:hypothetical protein
MLNIASTTMSGTIPQDMTKRDGSDCEYMYVKIFSHRIGSIFSPRRRTALIGRTDAKVPNITMKNTEANNI